MVLHPKRETIEAAIIRAAFRRCAGTPPAVIDRVIGPTLRRPGLQTATFQGAEAVISGASETIRFSDDRIMEESLRMSEPAGLEAIETASRDEITALQLTRL